MAGGGMEQINVNGRRGFSYRKRGNTGGDIRQGMREGGGSYVFFLLTASSNKTLQAIQFIIHHGKRGGGGMLQSRKHQAHPEKNHPVGPSLFHFIRPTSRNMLISMRGKWSWGMRGLITTSRKSLGSTMEGEAISDDATAAVITGW
ncbi:unnamed protein product [Ectocarpus sp. CCAP 1310/34]|nr:unnamed protein product [Ectocarpus sp. CCAP 1310/34]